MKRISILIVLSVVSLLSIGQSKLISDAIVYVPLNGHAGDSSQFQLHGVMNNVVSSTGINNQSGYACQFDGMTSKIQFSTNNRGVTDTVVASIWFKTTSSAFMFLVDKYDWTVDMGFHVIVNDGFVRLGGRNNGGAYVKLSSVATYNDNSWHHVVATMYGNVWELRVDCEIVDDAVSSAGSPSYVNNQPLSLGYYDLGSATGDHRYFEGQLDDFKMYKRKLTNLEMDTLCSVTEPLSVPGLLVNNDNWALYPNPSESRINLENVPMNSLVSIFSVDGKVVLEARFSGNAIDVTNIKPGIYFVKVKSKDQWSNKVIKMVKL